MAIYSGFSHWKWWFSIVMLVYQRVSDLGIFGSYLSEGAWKTEVFDGCGPIFWHCEWTMDTLFFGSYCKRLGWGNLRMSAAKIFQNNDFLVFQLLWRCQLFAGGSAWNEEMIGELMVNFRKKHIGNHEPTMIPTMIRPPWIAHLPLEFSCCVKCC